MATNDEFQTGEPRPEAASGDTLGTSRDSYPLDPQNNDVADEPKYPEDPPPLTFVPDSLAETTRKSGLAWSAGIVFFGSVAFIGALGWFADLLLGRPPWGLVVGIVLGSLVGFLQFFRIASRIFPQPSSQTPPRTLMSGDNDDA